MLFLHQESKLFIQALNILLFATPGLIKSDIPGDFQIYSIILKYYLLDVFNLTGFKFT